MLCFIVVFCFSCNLNSKNHKQQQQQKIHFTCKINGTYMNAAVSPLKLAVWDRPSYIYATAFEFANASFIGSVVIVNALPELNTSVRHARCLLA